MAICSVPLSGSVLTAVSTGHSTQMRGVHREGGVSVVSGRALALQDRLDSRRPGATVARVSWCVLGEC